jgi:hypothetical protein
MVEWAELLATLPDLTSMHGVKFFYEVSSIASTTIPPSNTSNNTYSNGQNPNSLSGSNINRKRSRGLDYPITATELNNPGIKKG